MKRKLRSILAFCLAFTLMFGNLANTLTVYAASKPGKTTIKAVTASSTSKVKVTVKKKSGVTGYQLRYSTKSSMKSAKTSGKFKSTSKTISGLKAGTKYYIQVRTYKKSGKKYAYSSWSSKKSVTTKKTSVSTTSLSGSAVSLTNVNGTCNSMDLSWKKISSVKGYQIQYATNNSFSNASSVTVSGASTINKTISGLTTGNTYYVRVRGYKTILGIKYYLAWSSTGSVTLSHSYGEPTYDWSSDGKSCSVQFACTNCDYSKTLDATISGEVKTPAGCETKGTTRYTASVTFQNKPYTDTKDVEDIDPSGHSYLLSYDWADDCSSCDITFSCENCDQKKTVEASVTSEVIEKETCKETGTILYTATATYDGVTASATRTISIPATGDHTCEWEVTTKPTCTEAGERSYVCSKCGTVTKTEIIEALGHDHIASVPDEDGYVTYTCSRCGDSYKEQIVHEHDYEVTSVTKATCTTPEITTYTCKCGSVKTEETAEALGHDYEMTSSTDPTCTKEGTKTYTCSACGNSYTESIPATGEHDYQETGKTAATCTEDGITTYTCSMCGDTCEEVNEKATGHSYTLTSRTEPTYNKEGSEIYTCENCGDTYTETLEVTSGITEDEFLTTSGTEIVTQTGKSVVLTGLNLGGWLLQEYWMCPVDGDPDIEKWTYLETLEVLEERFGEEKTQELIDTYEDNWITENDFKNIADMGYNVVRIPFWYRNFMSDDTGTWIDEDFDNNPGFQRLDWAIEMADKYGLYVILDMHGCPGGQTSDHHSGSARKCELFDNEEYQDVMEELWIAISDRYKDNPVVAAYDIMNEPEAQDYSGDSVMDDPRNQVYDRMFKAIRENGDEHIITVEAIWTLSALPYPEDTDWDNVVYQMHLYGNDPESSSKTLKNYSEKHQIPVYIGEFFDQSYYDIAGEMGISCTEWTYKGCKSTDSTYFVYGTELLSAADVINDPYWLIKLKWGSCLNTKYFSKL